jgi:hypothetical protein
MKKLSSGEQRLPRCSAMTFEKVLARTFGDKIGDFDKK